MRFYDRENEIEILKENELQSRKSAVFTVLMGRKRVGKTTLITTALKGYDYAYLFVSKDNEAVLCGKFQQTLQEQLGIQVYGTITHFRDLFEVIMKESLNRHFTIIFDEFQTLYKVNPAIFSEIQDLWDRYHRESHLNLITSGSIQSLMKRIFEKTFELLKEEHIPFVYLLPVDEAIYSWMGFEKICDFCLNRITDYEDVKEKYDVYCVRDDDYIRRMNKEDMLRSMDQGEVLPEDPVIMGKITDLDAFNKAAGTDFTDDKKALDWLKSKKIYICEEV